jgi:outer membrane protein assembly factor BamB
MYAHDAARTSASEGCAEGPLEIKWKLTRSGTCGFRFRPGRILQTIAEEGALFASVDCGDSPAVMRVTPNGEPMWTFSRGDFMRNSWPAITADGILSTDDGVYLVDRETGKYRGRELDVWGEPLVVGDSFFVDNTYQLDGAGPFLGAFDATLKWKWRVAHIIPGKGKAIQRTSGTAFADGVLVRSAAMGGHFVPTLTAHDPATGELKWLAKDIWPESAPSIADGRVFCLERWKNESSDRIVARALADGAVAWSTPTIWARGPAPVLAGKVVVVHGAEGVRAYDRATGKLAWSNPAPRTARAEESATTMAAAKGSGTLVVVSGPKLLILKLDDGGEQWSAALVSGKSPTTLSDLTLERPIVIGRSVYLTSDGVLMRLDPK